MQAGPFPLLHGAPAGCRGKPRTKTEKMMITRILSSRLPLMIYTPVKVFDISYFHAIYKAGATPGI
jgi:hypothetical protein